MNVSLTTDQVITKNLCIGFRKLIFANHYTQNLLLLRKNK